MSLDYYKVQPNRVALLGKNFTPGNINRNIRYITRHHTAGVLDADALNRVWQNRPASTHYLADPKGNISQHVWDKDVAWSNGNAASNAVTLTIEHSNNGGPGEGWPISDETLINGARWAAALCLYYKLGRPHFGTNIRDHKEFTGTSCPHHLANGGKYHKKWMNEAQRFYDALVNKTVNPDGTPKNIPSTTPTIQEDDMAFTDEDRKMLRTVYAELTKKFPSRSAYRTSDELVDTLAGFVLNVDGRQHEEAVGNAVKATGLTAEQVVEKLREGKNFAEIREEAHDA